MAPCRAGDHHRQAPVELIRGGQAGGHRVAGFFAVLPGGVFDGQGHGIKVVAQGNGVAGIIAPAAGGVAEPPEFRIRDGFGRAGRAEGGQSQAEAGKEKHSHGSSPGKRMERLGEIALWPA